MKCRVSFKITGFNALFLMQRLFVLLYVLTDTICVCGCVCFYIISNRVELRKLFSLHFQALKKPTSCCYLNREEDLYYICSEEEESEDEEGTL